MKRAMLAVMTLTLLTGAAFAQPADTDGDTIPDAIEAQIATDPDFAEPLELLFEDPTGEADTSRGADCVPFGDFGRIWFAPVAEGRFLWKIDLAAETQWPPAPHDVRILYVDADNDPSTGRPDMGPGCDIMFYLSPNREDRLIDWGDAVTSVTASDGRSIYLVADFDLNQQDGRSVFHARMLYQDTRDDHRANADHMPWTEFTAAGESDRVPVEVAEGHPLYVPPQAVRHLASRVVFDQGRPRAEITFTTDVPTRPIVQFGPSEDYGSTARGEESWNNHRIALTDLEPDREYHYRVRVRDRDGESVTDDATFSTMRPTPAPCSVERETVTLTVENPHSARADNAPITTGLPFPEGVLGDASHLRLLDADGRELPLQSEVTARHPDGSVQWLLLDFVADIPAESNAAYAVEFGSEVERTVEPEGISVAETDGTLVVDTGELRVIFDPAHSDLIAAAHVDADDDGRYSREEAVLNERIAGPSSITVRDGEEIKGYLTSLAAPRVEVERAGPLSTVVKVSGTHTNTDGNDLFRFISRYHFTVDSGLVRVKHTVENDQTQQTLTRIEDYGMGLPVWLGEDATVTIEAAGGDRLQSAPTEEVTLVQDLSDHWSLMAPATHQQGERGPASIDVSAADRGLWVGLRHFWEKWPSSLAWEPDLGAISVYLLPPFEDDRYADLGDAVESDRLYYHLRDGGYRLHWGVSFTREMWLGFHEGDAWPEAWAQQLREPLIAVAEPQWYCDSGAFGPQVPRKDGRFARFDEMVEKTFEGLMNRREANRSYGFLNFGDWWGERGYNWGNMEYDTPHGQMVQFIRTGDRKFFDEACHANVHNRDVDYAHHKPGGRDYFRTRSHRMFHTGGYEPRMADEQMGLAYYTDAGLTGVLSGHQWNRGGFDHYFMTGEQRSWDVALGLADYMAGPGTVSFSMGRGAERCVAWALYDVLSAYRVTWDPFYLNAARLMVEDVIERQTEAGHWSIPAGYSKVDPLPIGGYAWCSGLLITWLHEYNQYAEDPRVDEVILNAAEWLVREEYMPERKGFRSCSCDTFNDKTRAGHSSWSVATPWRSRMNSRATSTTWTWRR